MKNLKIMAISAIMVVVASVVCAADGPIPFDVTITIRSAKKQSEAGVTKNAPDEGEAYYCSFTKSAEFPNESQIVLTSDKKYDLTNYKFFIFDVTVDSLDLLKDVTEFSPRIYTEMYGSYFQVLWSDAWFEAINKLQRPGTWVTVKCPLNDTSKIRGLLAYKNVLDKIGVIELIFIHSGRADTKGMWYFRNLRFE